MVLFSAEASLASSNSMCGVRIPPIERTRRLIFYRIMAPNEREVIVDQVGNMSTSKEKVLFLGFLFLQTDFPFEMGIMDDLVQG